MKPGRIEAYVHSDRITENKAGVLVKLTCDTDFAAKTDEFKAFATKVAKLACGFGPGETSEDQQAEDVWNALVGRVGYLGDTDTLETERQALASKLRETITVETVTYLTL